LLSLTRGIPTHSEGSREGRDREKLCLIAAQDVKTRWGKMERRYKLDGIPKKKKKKKKSPQGIGEGKTEEEVLRPPLLFQKKRTSGKRPPSSKRTQRKKTANQRRRPKAGALPPNAARKTEKGKHQA